MQQSDWPSSQEIVSAIGQSNSEVLNAIETSKDELLHEMRREFSPTHVDIEDEVLRNVVGRIEHRTHKLAMQAKREQEVDLTLDDLFEVVTDLIPKARDIKAVDLEIDRWATDDRALTYAEKNLAALKAGAIIKRVYVIPPSVTDAMMDVIESTLIQHLNFNSKSAVEQVRGRMQIGVLHHEDITTRGTPRDFAVFDDQSVLYETFKEDWSSTFHGKLTKDCNARDDYTAYFKATWEAARELLSPADVKEWGSQMRERLAVGEAKTDVFFGYANAAWSVASEIVNFIQRYNYTVFNWRDHLRPGPNLLDEISAARNECRLGLFLFTGEDVSASGDPTPRDNVVLEYGYFLGGKSAEEVVIIVQSGIEKPTDVEGSICLNLSEDGRISSISDQLRNWLEAQLGPRDQSGR